MKPEIKTRKYIINRVRSGVIFTIWLKCFLRKSQTGSLKQAKIAKSVIGTAIANINPVKINKADIMNPFLTLAVIDFESERIDFYEMVEAIGRIDPQAVVREVRDQAYQDILFQTWRLIWNMSPHYHTLDWLMTKLFSKGFDFFGISFGGYNAMMWAITWNWGGYWWIFRPPCFLILGGRGWTWGRLYKSPNATTWHPDAKIFYGKPPF